MKLRWSAFLLAFFAVQLVTQAILAKTYHETSIQVKVEAVHDGDTFTTHLGGLVDKVRLLGVDAPELKQPRWGIASRDRLAGLVLGKTVRVEVDEVHPRDAYGRLVGYVYVGTILVQKDMLESGLAVTKAYGSPPRLFEVLTAFEQGARARKIGIWGDATFVDPQVYRQQHGVGR